MSDNVAVLYSSGEPPLPEHIPPQVMVATDVLRLLPDPKLEAEVRLHDIAIATLTMYLAHGCAETRSLSRVPNTEPHPLRKP